MMAEAAARDGFDVAALDLFGDTDTRRASLCFSPIGVAGALHIDGARLLAALGDLARRGDVIGWVAGSGFEGQPELLAQGAGVLRLIGTAPDAVRRVRDPALFFGFLSAQGLTHPPVQTTPPTDAAGWLLKDGHGCGGWHIRHAAQGEPLPSASHYFQRQAAGRPMSATFIANGLDAVLLGVNELTVRPLAGRPFVFNGVVGPVPVAHDVTQRVTAAVRALSAGFALRGLCSLDFLLDADRIAVLEVNPRPPASMALYAGLPLMRLHVRACTSGELPARPGAAPSVCASVSGHQIVFARQAVMIDERKASALTAAADVHDLPAAGMRFEAGDPVCSLSAHAAHAAQVKALLDARCRHWLTTLETPE